MKSMAAMRKLSPQINLIKDKYKNDRQEQQKEMMKLYKVNKIVSLGITSYSGRPHAEYNAIHNFNFKKNKKYTLYSTLEPCCHDGRGPSCVSKIIDSKFINRVVFASIDPDIRVNGKGKKKLVECNIDVSSGYLSTRISKKKLLSILMT